MRRIERRRGKGIEPSKLGLWRIDSGGWRGTGGGAVEVSTVRIDPLTPLDHWVSGPFESIFSWIEPLAYLAEFFGVDRWSIRPT